MPSDKTVLEACDVTRIRVTGDHQIAVRFRDGLIAELNMGRVVGSSTRTYG